MCPEFRCYCISLQATFQFAPVDYMQRDLVEQHKWVTREDYLEGLGFLPLCPRPLAAQLAKYLGWVHSGTLGATLTGAAFILPSFLMVFGLVALYVHFGRLAWIPGLFYGIAAAISAIIVRSVWTFIQKTVGFLFAVLTGYHSGWPPPNYPGEL